MNTISNRWKHSFSKLWREENNGISRLRKFKIKNWTFFLSKIDSRDKTLFYEKGQKFSLIKIVSVCRYWWKNSGKLFQKLEIDIPQILFELIAHSSKILISYPLGSFYPYAQIRLLIINKLIRLYVTQRGSSLRKVVRNGAYFVVF